MNLVELDLSKKYGPPYEENGHRHPDIKLKTNYLAKIGGQFFAGTFIEVWFGLNFDGWHAPLQYDRPGTNSSRWERLWEIIE